METGSLDFLLDSDTVWQLKLEVFKYCKALKSKNPKYFTTTDLPKDINEIKATSIYDLAQILFAHLITGSSDIKEFSVSLRRFIPEIILISLESNINQLTQDEANKAIILSKTLSILLGLYKSIKDKVYLFFKKQKEQFNYSPLNHLEELLQGDQSSETVETLFESIIRFLFFDFRLFKEIWGLKLDVDIGKLRNMSHNIRFGYITFMKNVLGLSTEQTYSLFESLFQISSESLEFYDLIKAFDQYAEKIYAQVLHLKSYFLSVSQEKGGDSDVSEDDMDEILQGRPKKINSQERYPDEINTNLVVLDSQRKVLQELWRRLILDNFIILNGVSGTGKSSYLSLLQQKMKRTSITLYMDGQTDFKSLLGNYTCSEKVGEFEWKKGPLVSAMENGSWLILENFQEANEELINSIITCVQTGQIRLASVGQTIHSAIGFKVIAVTDVHFGRHDHNVSASLMSLYETAAILDLNEKFNFTDFREIYHSVFNKKSKNSNDELAFDMFNRIFDSLLCDKTLTDTLNHQQKKALNLNLRNFSSLLHRFWAQIVNVYGETGLNSNTYTTEAFRKNLFLEILDCVFYKAKDIRSYDTLLIKMAEILQLPFEELMTYIENYSPEIELRGDRLKLGRLGTVSSTLFLDKNADNQVQKSESKIIYNAYTKRIIEKIAGCLVHGESCLLVGDTGCGKTTIAQHVAELFGKKLHVYNLSQGSDAIDLVGGYKPVDMKILIKKLLKKYLKNLSQVASEKSNKKFIESLQTLYANKDFNKLLLCMIESFKMVKPKLNTKFEGEMIEKMTKKWEKLETRVTNIYRNRDKIETSLVFDFMEGNLIKAIKEGDWILIDEINLANNELLQKLLPVIEGHSLIIFEKGDLKEIKRNKNFKLIACMNPGTDIGKKELPENLRAKFTEFFINDLEDRVDLLVLVERVLSISFDRDTKEKLVDFYLWLRKSSDKYELEDGYNKRPHFSLRNLSRAMSYMNKTAQMYGKLRAVYEGIFIGFGSVLSTKSQETLQTQIERTFGFSKANYSQAMQQVTRSIPGYLNIFGFYMKQGGFPAKKPEETDFEVTPTFQKYLIELMRIVTNTNYAVLLEGPTSSGKTSIIKFIAEITGYKCVRVNNHHHTDIEEYIGTYMPNSKGKLVFQEGILVEAVRKGYWIILDELNLARSEILESLNRLLDDNAELFIPEQQIHIKPHENFRLFATQNPIHYSGRKELSKAFKNRFIQIYFDDINDDDLQKIILKRCKIAPSFCQKLLKVMKELQIRRQTNNFFMGKEAAITVRDLIKWAKRPFISSEQLAIEGYCILAERLRTDEDRAEVRSIIEKAFKCKIEPGKYYQQYTESPEFLDSRRKLDEFLAKKSNYSGISTVQWNASFRRMATLVDKCLKSKEPVLLIGETGCGKTTICQLMSILNNVPFYAINCHHYTESMDFLGSLRPLRNREELQRVLDEKKKILLEQLTGMETEQNAELLETVTKDIPVDMKMHKLTKILEGLAPQDPLTKALSEFIAATGKNESLFEWQDGPLTQAMRNGGIFLIDEISLADDSVLERMNSVLEAERTLTLSEKTDEVDMIVAHGSFFILATMNPGGDFGKRELSPALRNRFTEVWVEPITARHYLNYHYSEIIYDIVEHKRPYEELFNEYQNDCLNMLAENVEKNEKLAVEYQGDEALNVQTREVKYELALLIFRFLRYFNLEFCEKYLNEKKYLSLRDILTLIHFMERCQGLPIKQAYTHGLHVMILDSIGMYFDNQQRTKVMQEIDNFLRDIISQTKYVQQDNFTLRKHAMAVESIAEVYTFGHFSAPVVKSKAFKEIRFSTESNTVQENLGKVMRALQIEKAIMLEGAPGIGKSSLVEYIANRTGNKLLKINLSEQTDLMDLLGCDVPKGQDKGAIQDSKLEFGWADGLLLKALKKGYWIILNELNLANQTVLEGLNACLDHRGAVFIPELNQEFIRHPNFRIFATQNPIQKGGGRKSLPSSFLNRFSKVYIEEYVAEDFYTIIQSLYPQTNQNLLHKLVQYNTFVKEEVIRTSPEESWEFNLRDILRVCDMLEKGFDLQESIDLIYIKRLKKVKGLESAIKAYEQVFEAKFLTTEFFDLPLYISTKDALEVKYYNGALNQRKSIKLDKLAQPQPKPNQNTLRASIELNFSKFYLKDVMKALSFAWPLLLTGPKGCGKSTLIKNIGEVLNKRVVTIHLNASTDSSDLIGNYDQEDVFRKMQEFIQTFDSWINDTLFTSLYQPRSLNCLALVNYLQSLRFELARKTGLDTLNVILDVIKAVQDNIQHVPNSTEVAEQITKFKETADNYLSVLSDAAKKASWFNWFNSELIAAVIRGDWVVLENIGGCNSAILERLNPLLENDTKFYINECGNVDGKSFKVRPHKEFRIFMITSGGNDKISSALRNRCVEINMSIGSISNVILNNQLPDNLETQDEMAIEEQALIPAPKQDKKDSNEPTTPIETTFEDKYKMFWRKVMVADMYRLMEMQGVFSSDVQNSIISLVITGYSLLSRARGSDRVTFELNSFTKFLKKFKENREFENELNTALEKAFLESYRPLFKQHNEKPERVLTIVSETKASEQPIILLNLKDSLNLDSTVLDEMQSYISKRLHPNIALNSQEEANLIHHLWLLSGVSFEDSLDANTLRTLDAYYTNILMKNTAQPLSMIPLNAFEAKAASIFDQGLNFTIYLMNKAGLEQNSVSLEDVEQAIYILYMSSLSGKILELSLKIKNKLKPTDASTLQEILNLASGIQDALQRRLWSLTQKNHQLAMQKIVQVYFLLFQKFDIIIKSFTYAGPILREMITKQIQSITNRETTSEHSKPQENQERAIRLNNIFQKSNLLKLLPKKPEFYLFIHKVFYLLEKDNTKYNRILGNYRADLEANQKLNSVILLDDKFTSSFYKLFGNLTYNLNYIPVGKEEAYQKILNLTLDGLLPRINEAFETMESKKSLIYLDIEEEYNRNILKTIPVLTDDYSVQYDIKMNAEKNRFMLIHEYLFLQVLENICQILMTQTCLTNASNSSFKNEYKRLFDSEELKLNILDSNLSGEFKLYLSFLFEKVDLSFEMLLEFKSRVYVEQLFWQKRCAEAGINKDDLLYLVYRGMEEIQLNETLKSYFVSSNIASDLNALLKSQIRIKKDNTYGDIFFVINWLFKSFWNDKKEILEWVRQLLTLANDSETLKTIQGQEELKKLHQDFLNEVIQARGMQTEDLETKILTQIQDEILSILKSVVDYACAKVDNTSKFVKMNIGWKIWSLFNIFEAESSKTFSSRLFKSKLRLDLLHGGKSLLELKTAGLIVSQIEQSRLNNEESAEYQALLSQMTQIEAKLLKRQKEYIVRCSDLENPFELFDDFLSTNTKYIHQIHKFFSNITGFTMTQDKVIEVQNVINNWVLISYQGSFLNFKDILIPLFYACDLINKGCEEVIQTDQKIDSLALYSSTNIDEQMNLQSSVTEVVQLLKSASQVLPFADTTELFAKLLDLLKFQTVNSKEDLVPSVIVFALDILGTGLKLKEDENDDDPATKFLKMQKRLQEAVIDEYTKEGVQIHKEREEEEIEARFQKKETKDALDTLVSFQNNIKDVLDHLNSMNEFTKTNRLKANLEDLILKVIRLRKPETTQNKSQKLINGIMEILSYLKSQNKEFLQNKGLENLFYYLSRKNRNLANTQENYNFYSNENPDELCKLYFISQKLLDKCNRHLKEEIFFSNPTLQSIALLIDHFLTLYLNYTPLAKLLPFLSLLTQKLEEWNSTVPRDFKINEDYTELIELTLKWRKLERDSWKDMIEESDKKYERKELVNVLQIWYAVINDNDEGIGFRKMFDVFVKTTQFGNFSLRLQTLKNLVDVCKLANRTNVVELCNDIIRHFEYFADYHKKKKEELIRQIQKDIQKYVDLSKWDNRDHNALRISTEKYHRKLNKILKKYEDFLECPIEKALMEPVRKEYLTESVNHFLTIYEGDFAKKSNKKTRNVDITRLKGLLQKTASSQEMDANAKLIYNNLINVVVQILDVIPEKYYSPIVVGTHKDLTKIKKPSSKNKKKTDPNATAIEEEEEGSEIKNLCDYLKANTEGFLDRIKSLRDEKTPRPLKMKAYVDFIKFVKDLGIKETAYKTDTEERLIDAINFSLLQGLDKINGCGVSENIFKKLTKSKKYEDRIIDYLTILERNKQFHQDLGIEYIVRGENFAKSLWTCSLHFRRKLNTVMEEVGTFYKLYNTFAYVFNVKGTETFFANNAQKEFSNIHSLAIETVSGLKMLFQSLDACGIALDDPILGALRDLINLINKLKDHLNPFVEKELSKIASKDIETLSEQTIRISDKIVEIQKGLCKQDKQEYASDSIVFNHLDLLDSQWKKIKTWAASFKGAKLGELSAHPQNVQLDLDSINKGLLLFSQNKSKSTKKYLATISKFVYDDEEAPKEQARKVDNLIENELKNLSKDIKLLKDFNLRLTSGLLTHEIFQIVPENLHFIDFLKLAKKLVDSQLLEHVRSLKMTEKFSYITLTTMFNLFYKGFCIPPEVDQNGQDADDDGDGQFQAGTGAGMGEGQGMENVSKEIQFEEQVLGEQGGEDQQEDQKEYDKEEDGVDMENDFDGKNYDEKKPGNEEEEEEQANKEEKADDEFSEVDDELDHKMWNEDEEEKEQQDEEEKEGADEEDPLRKEEDLEFHDQNQMEQDNVNEKAKEEERPKDKSDKRNVKDYDEVEDQREEDEQKSQESFDEEEYEKVEDEKDRKDRGQEEEEDEEDKDKKAEENSIQQEEGEDDNKDEENMSFESEGGDINPEEVPEEDNKEHEMEEEKPEVDVNANQEAPEKDLPEEEEKEQGEDAEEEENQENEKKYDSTQDKKKEDNKVQKTKGAQNQAGEQKEDQEDKNGDQQNPDEEEENKGDSNITQRKDVLETKENFEDLLRKFVQNFEKTESLELDNFIKDLQITGEKKPEEEKDQQKPPPVPGMEQLEAPENFEYEILEPQGDGDTSKMMKTNAPSSSIKHELERPANNEANKPTTQEENQNEAQTVFLEEEEQKQEEEGVIEDDQVYEDEAPKKPQKKEKQQTVPKERDNQPKEDLKDMLDKAQDKYLNSIREKIRSMEEEPALEEKPIEQKQPERKAKKDNMEVEEQKIDLTLDPTLSHNEMKESLQQLVSEWKSDTLNQERGIEIWNKFENAARHQAMALCEELKAVLQPTEIASLKGDYKSGKRLNMKKIIPYIASNYRKDKIWLRRADPSKRKFQVMLAIDDSLSMSEQNVGFFALESLTTLALAMSKLEVGQISISRIEDGMKLLHPFDTPLTSAEGPYILSQFTFEYQSPMSSDLSLPRFLRSSIDLFKEWKVKEKASEQICFIMSDGRFNKNLVRSLLQEAEENGICFIFVILDSKNEKESVLSIKSTSTAYVNGKLDVKITNYMDDFPFKYYLVVKDIATLPRHLIDILRQYFERND